MRSLRYLVAFAAVGALALTGCSSGGSAPQSDEQSGPATATSDEVVTLVVGASPSPHAKILQYVQDNLAEEAGLKLDIVEYTDYVQPNEALEAGDLDANFYQTVPYLEAESESRGYDFIAGEGVHLEPLAVYSQKIDDLKDLPKGGTIGVINDPSNQGRALTLLADAGLVELPASGDINVTTVKKLKEFDFVEVEGAQLARSLPDVDVAVINGNFAQEAGLAPADSLLIESPENNPAVNVLVWGNGAKNEAAILQLNELLRSPQVRDFILEQWPDGSVIPAF